MVRNPIEPQGQLYFLKYKWKECLEEEKIERRVDFIWRGQVLEFDEFLSWTFYRKNN